MLQRYNETGIRIIITVYGAGNFIIFVHSLDSISNESFNKTILMKKLHVLWTTGEKDVALRMIFIYLMDAKSMGWWDEINLIIWGPSAKLVAENKLVQRELDFILQSGITVQACQGCTEAYGVTGKIAALGITVRYMGEPLTEYLQKGEKLITF